MKHGAPSLFDLAFDDTPNMKLERKHAADFGNRLAGVDEAGRGPWAGPVVTAAVILDYDNLPVGLMILCPPMQEGMLLRIGQAVEEILM